MPLVAALVFLAPAAPDFLAVVVEAEATGEGEDESFFSWSLTARRVVFSPSSGAIVAGDRVSEIPHYKNEEGGGCIKYGERWVIVTERM